MFVVVMLGGSRVVSRARGAGPGVGSELGPWMGPGVGTRVGPSPRVGFWAGQAMSWSGSRFISRWVLGWVPGESGAGSQAGFNNVF